MALTQFDERVINVSPNEQTAGAVASNYQVAAGVGYGTRYDQFLLSWNGAATFEVDIRVSDGFGDVATLGTLTLPASIGTETTTTDVLAALFPADQRFLILNAGGSVGVVTKATITGTDVMGAYLSGGNF